MSVTVKLALRLAYDRRNGSIWRQVSIPFSSAIIVLVGLFLVGFFHTADRVDDRVYDRSYHGIWDSEEDHKLLTTLAFDVWNDRQFEVRYVQPLTDDAPLPPGLERWPGAGEFAVSPELKRAIDSSPLLQERYAVVDVIGDSGITDGRELLAYAGPPLDSEIPASLGVPLLQWGGDSNSNSDERTDLHSLRFPALVLLGLPTIFLALSAVHTTAAVRERRAHVLHWIGVPRRAVARVAALEVAALALPGACAGGLVWLLLHSKVTRLPLTGFEPLRGDLAVSGVEVAGAIVSYVVLIAGYAYLRGRSMPRTTEGTRPWATRRLSPLGLLPGGAGLLLFIRQVLDPSPAGSFYLQVATPLLLAAGAAYIAPFVVREVGSVTAEARRSVVALLAGRGIQRDPAGYTRPLLGLGVFVFLALIGVALVAAESQYEERITRRDSELAAATVVYLPTGEVADSEDIIAGKLPDMVVGAIDRSTFRIAVECTSLDTLFDGSACTADGALSESVRERLDVLLGLPGHVSVSRVEDLPPDPERLASSVVIIGKSSPEFASTVTNAVMPEFLTVQVLTLDDYTQRASAVWGWVQGGLAVGGLLVAMGLLIAAVDRSMHDATADKLRALGTSLSMRRRLVVARFMVVYGIVVGLMFLIGLLNGWLIIRSAPHAQFPTDGAAWILVSTMALPLVGAAALAVGRRADVSERDPVGVLHGP